MIEHRLYIEKNMTHHLLGHENVLYVSETDPAVETYPVTAKTKEEAFADFRTSHIRSFTTISIHEMLSSLHSLVA